MAKEQVHRTTYHSPHYSLASQWDDCSSPADALYKESRRNLLKWVSDSPSSTFAVCMDKRPDVLVSDIGMPEVDGYRLILEVRRLPDDQGGNTPAAALTAFARSEDRRRALMAGYESHIAKPVEPAELIAVVASLAGRMRRKDQKVG